MKFQNINIHVSKVMLCTGKRDERTDKPEATCPNFFQSLGQKDLKLLVFQQEDFLSGSLNETMSNK